MLLVKRALCSRDVLEAAGRTVPRFKIVECEAEERRGGLATGGGGQAWEDGKDEDRGRVEGWRSRGGGGGRKWLLCFGDNIALVLARWGCWRCVGSGTGQGCEAWLQSEAGLVMRSWNSKK